MPRKNNAKPSPSKRRPNAPCEKTAYHSKTEIVQVINNREQADEIELEYYLCPQCGKWHLTRKKY